MRSIRVIPCLDVDGGRVVKGVNFLNLRDAVCHERNRARPDRSFGPHVVRRHNDNLRRSLPGLCRRLRRRGDKPVPGLALESGSCRLIWGNAARILRVASAFPQNWAFSSSILPMCSRSWV